MRKLLFQGLSSLANLLKWLNFIEWLVDILKVIAQQVKPNELQEPKEI